MRGQKPLRREGLRKTWKGEEPPFKQGAGVSTKTLGPAGRTRQRLETERTGLFEENATDRAGGWVTEKMEVRGIIMKQQEQEAADTPGYQEKRKEKLDW